MGPTWMLEDKEKGNQTNKEKGKKRKHEVLMIFVRSLYFVV